MGYLDERARKDQEYQQLLGTRGERGCWYTIVGHHCTGINSQLSKRIMPLAHSTIMLHILVNSFYILTI